MGIIFTLQNGREHLASQAGLALIGALLADTHLHERLSAISLEGGLNPTIAHGDIATAMIGLLCLGKPDFAAIEPFRQDPFFRQSLGLQACPSEATLRQRLDRAGTSFAAIVKDESARILQRRMPPLRRFVTSAGAFVPLDGDVSPFDNSRTQKEGVSLTYKGYEGYAPMFAYLGMEGYLLNAELREGKQHCQAGTPAFLRESLRYAARITSQKLLVRLDAGNDSQDNIAVCLKAGVDWIIKRNLRKESLDDWLALAKRRGTPTRPREGKTVWRGDTYRDVSGDSAPLRIVFEVIERTSTAAGQGLLIPEIEVKTWWTSLPCPPDEVIALYEEHGTSEQYHAELKTDMGLERLPSGAFETNAGVLLLGMLAYNLLRLCGQESLRTPEGAEEHSPAYRRSATRRRVRTVMQDLMYVACRVITHARTWRLSFGRHCPWNAVWTRLYHTFTTPVSAHTPRA
jgi:hypothetical protein